MTDYKNTLNLPHTDFPMKGNLPEREPQILDRWKKLNIYQSLRNARANRKKFILHIGPPYANGHIHLGTATNNILKDIVVKSKSLSGFDSPLVPGWDCHGLPIELNVEKKIGKPGVKVTAKEFREACRDYAANFINIQRQEFIRLGMIADFDHPYMTMDFKYEANIIRSLAKIIENKHVIRGYKPVHWCLDCASALAEAEVEYAEKKSPSIDVRFRVADINDFYTHAGIAERINKPISVPIWTTTPWTLPANEAVALNPLVDYVLVETPNEIFLVAKDLLPIVMQRYQVSDYRIIDQVIGEKLLNVKVKHPFYEKEVPLVLGEHVLVDSGTGAVHTSPAHGLDDYHLGKLYHLPLDNPVGDDGLYIDGTPIFAGMHVNKVNDKIIETLKMHDNLIFATTLVHSYPHCWRHKTPLIFRATPQWFISMDDHHLRRDAIHAIDRVKWIPDWGITRIKSMVENPDRPDWCISRQRAWGVPITLFTHKKTGELHPETISIMEKVAKKVEEQGVDAWYQMDISEVMSHEDAKHYQKSNDILDVWFDSGVSHECVLKVRPELRFPADIVLEGSDQHRGWFQSSLLTSVAINGVEPYREVLTHGFLVDGQGRKMSKSIGNVIAPDEITNTSGADLLRLWVASTDYRSDIAVSKEILTRTSETYRRIRNTARFLLANLYGFDPEKHLIADDQMLKLDQYIVSQAYQLQQDILSAYDQYQFHIVVQKLHQFCVTDLGGFYLDIIKDRQYTMLTDSLGRRSAQTALYHIAQSMVRLMAPILSFTAEEIWQYLPKQNEASVLLSEWYQGLKSLPKDALMNDDYWGKIRLIRDAVNKEIEEARNLGKIGSALEASVTIYCHSQIKNMLDVLGEELRFILITSQATVVADPSPADVTETGVPGLYVKVIATEAAKCERCWHRRSDVNLDSEYPGLCSRCIINIKGPGEIRHYA